MIKKIDLMNKRLRVGLIIFGLIEGIAESTASLLKVFSGWLSDKVQKRKIFAVYGYTLSTISKIIIGVALSWPTVLLGRFIDSFWKDIRTSARDALIAESATKENVGRAFGFHRALDTAGAVFGPLAAILLINHFGSNNLRPIFYIALIPGIIGVILLLIFVKEKAAEAAEAIGEGLQAFCIPGSVADQRQVGIGHGNLAAMLLRDETKCFAFLAGHESVAVAIEEAMK